MPERNRVGGGITENIRKMHKAANDATSVPNDATSDSYDATSATNGATSAANRATLVANEATNFSSSEIPNNCIRR